MAKTDTSKTTTVRLTPADQRNAKRIIQKGYVSNVSAAIRYALAMVARGGDR